MGKEGIDERIEKIIGKINLKLQTGLDETLQAELAGLINLLPSVRSNDPDLIVAIDVAISALLTDPPNLQLASEIQKDVVHRLKKPQLVYIYIRLRNFFNTASPSTIVILGLMTFLFFGIPLLLTIMEIIIHSQPFEYFIMRLKPNVVGFFILVGFFGALGSIVSIMSRLQDYAAMKDVGSSVLFFTGFFKPIIGMSFALFIYASLQAKLISLTIDQANASYFFVATSFISGFSERFVRDVEAKAEQKITAT